MVTLLNYPIWLRELIFSNKLITLVNQKPLKLGEDIIIDPHLLELGLTYNPVLVEFLLAVDSHLLLVL